MIWDGFDQRRFPRFPLSCKVSILQKKKSAVGLSNNLSLGGLSVNVKKRFNKMGSCELQIELHKRYKVMECQGRIVWAVPVRSKKNNRISRSYDLGIEFIEVSPAMKRRIKRILDSRIART